jgi:hypothetical protein
MSDKSIYESRKLPKDHSPLFVQERKTDEFYLEKGALTTHRNPSPFGAPPFYLLGSYSREKIYTIIGQLGTLEMSDKSIYESQKSLFILCSREKTRRPPS